MNVCVTGKHLTFDISKTQNDNMSNIHTTHNVSFQMFFTNYTHGFFQWNVRQTLCSTFSYHQDSGLVWQILSQIAACLAYLGSCGDEQTSNNDVLRFTAHAVGLLEQTFCIVLRGRNKYPASFASSQYTNVVEAFCYLPHRAVGTLLLPECFTTDPGSLSLNVSRATTVG